MKSKSVDISPRSLDEHDRRLSTIFVVLVFFGLASAIMLPVVALTSIH